MENAVSVAAVLSLLRDEGLQLGPVLLLRAPSAVVEKQGNRIVSQAPQQQATD